MFRHREDRLPVALVLALTAVDLVVYLMVDNLWWLLCYFLVMVIPKGIASAWNHHHQHVPTFRVTWLNRVLEFLYGLHTGMPTNMWVLHHVLGHHVNYLDQTKDESAWMGKNGRAMGEIHYTLNIAATAYPRALAVGRRFPKLRRAFLAYGALTWSAAALLIWIRPLAGIAVFGLPMVVTMFYTAWVTYDHHVGLETEDPYAGSYNIMNRWFNRLTGNLGYHTAHHLKQGVHWSRLPELHERIKDRIPAYCFTTSLFDFLLPNPPLSSAPSTSPPAG